MTEKTLEYARGLHSIANAEVFLQSAASILEAVPAVGEELNNPTVELSKKCIVVDSIFPHEIRNFLKLLCSNGDFDLFNDFSSIEYADYIASGFFVRDQYSKYISSDD